LWPGQSSFGIFDTKQQEKAGQVSKLDLTDFHRDHMRKLRVAVVGLGALGGEAVRCLGLLRIGRIILVDFDIVESGNLTNSILFSTSESIGHKKSVVVSKSIRRYFPSTESLEFCREIADVGFNVLREVDLILSCVDSDWARLDIAYIARQLSIPVCDAGLGAPDYRHGRVSFLPKPTSAACYGCLMSPARRRELLLERDYSTASCSRPPVSAPVSGRSGGMLPGTPMMASMVAALQVDCGLRELGRTADASYINDASYTINLDLAGTPGLERIAHPHAVSCPFHEPLDTRLPSASRQTARDLLRDAGRGKAILLDWPICTRCRCDTCGHQWRPMKRTAVLRRLGACPACGSDRLSPVETLDLISPESPWAGTPFSALGLPDGHLFAVVGAGA
jgi:molybdopterin/thiamine biosynthesis adenylyltransferase